MSLLLWWYPSHDVDAVVVTAIYRFVMKVRRRIEKLGKKAVRKSEFIEKNFN